MGSAAERWDDAYRARFTEGTRALPDTPSAVVADHLDALPRRGSAISIACGLAPNARLLMRRGLTFMAADVSTVALGAIEALAMTERLPVQVRELDTEAGDRPAGRYDVVVITYFVDRELLDDLPVMLAPGGVALFAQPTVTNLERHANPSARFCLGVGEVVTIAERLAARGLEIITADEAWRERAAGEPAHEGWLVVRRDPDSDT